MPRGDTTFLRYVVRHVIAACAHHRNTTPFHDLIPHHAAGPPTHHIHIHAVTLDVEKGEVLLDGKPLKDWKPSFLATQIAVVQQESAIL